MERISRQQWEKSVRKDDAILVEVVDPRFYGNFHLPGVILVPWDERFEVYVEQAIPDKRSSIIVYSLNDATRRPLEAAARIERLGYSKVYDYEESLL